jgi:hypothetical protein
MAKWIVLCVGIITCVCTARIPCCAQETGQNENCSFMKLQGRIVAVDWMSSTIVVSDIQSADQITFLVPRETKITKGANTISFSDLNVQDQVSIEYCDAHFVGLKALSVAVKI